jgi:O-antigen/teichoic acid export membrane protein
VVYIVAAIVLGIFIRDDALVWSVFLLISGCFIVLRVLVMRRQNMSRQVLRIEQLIFYALALLTLAGYIALGHSLWPPARYTLAALAVGAAGVAVFEAAWVTRRSSRRRE